MPPTSSRAGRTTAANTCIADRFLRLERATPATVVALFNGTAAVFNVAIQSLSRDLDLPHLQTMTTLPSLAPDIRLFGDVNEGMLSEFFRQQAETKVAGPIVFELSTSGGDAEAGRRIAEELRLWQLQDRELYFLGKTYVFSAGITIMAAIPKSRRFLTADCELLIHERKMKATITLDGALRGCRAKINDVLAEIESGQRLQTEGFARLVKDSKVTVQDIEQRVLEKDWYLTAAQALEHELVAGVV